MTNEREPLWSDKRIRDRYHALVPCEANMGEMEYWNVLRDVGERVSYELRDEYESTIDTLISDNNRIFDRAATRLAEIYELRARIAELEARLAQTPTIPPDVRETLRKLADYGMPLGATNHDWRRWRDAALSWLDAQEGPT